NIYFGPSGLDRFFGGLNQGRRAPLRFALAPGYYISRLWRSDALAWFYISRRAARLPLAFIFRACGALMHLPGFYISRRAARLPLAFISRLRRLEVVNVNCPRERKW